MVMILEGYITMYVSMVYSVFVKKIVLRPADSAVFQKLTENVCEFE